jgi:hypothetical protein
MNVRIGKSILLIAATGAVLIVWNPASVPRTVLVGDEDWSGSTELPPASLSTISWMPPPTP